jgi:hypothetical protein
MILSRRYRSSELSADEPLGPSQPAVDRGSRNAEACGDLFLGKAGVVSQENDFAKPDRKPIDDFSYQVVRTFAFVIRRWRFRIPQISSGGFGPDHLSGNVAADSGKPLLKPVVPLQLAKRAARNCKCLLGGVFGQMWIEEHGSSNSNHASIVAPVQLAETIDVTAPGSLKQCHVVSITHHPRMPPLACRGES